MTDKKKKDYRIAKTIQAQVGGKALFMLGAHTQIAGDDWYSFRFKGSKVANYLKITLKGDDTYTMSFLKIWGTKVKEVKEIEGVYFDQLHGIIESTTGLYTSL